jgi:hypothetical protein
MKKHFYLSMILMYTVICGYSQWLPMEPMSYLNYYYGNANNKQMLMKDTLIYLCKHVGLEEININNYSINDKWAGYYQVKKIVADTGGTYVFLRNNNFVGRFNPSSQSYENIWPENLSNKNLSDVDVSAGGKIWATTTSTKEVIVYDGSAWTLYQTNAFGFVLFNSIKTVNDDLAYIQINGGLFLKFQNGVFDTLFYFQSYVKDWDVDGSGNLWAAAGNKLIHFYNGITTVYDTSNTPIGNDEFLHIRIGTNGHIWTAGNTKKLLEYDGTNWQSHNFFTYYATIENFALDAQNRPWIVAYVSDRRLFKPVGNSWTYQSIPFMPIKNSKAMGLQTQYSNYGYFANDEGYFRVYLTSPYYVSFTDTASVPNANVITCFAENDHGSTPLVFGSDAGVGNLPGFDNSMLPSQKVNHIWYDNGTYYIGTDSGLVAFNGILYYNINTSNSPLPSDKITYITTGMANYMCNISGGLYIGTDKGLAVYKSGQWTVFDTTNIPVGNFNITGVLPPCYEDEIYISTMGNGIIKITPNGNHELFNTANGNLPDDSLYYVKYMFLVGCGDFIVTGTKHHGIAYSSLWGPVNFEYIDNYGGTPLLNSTMAVNGKFHEMNLISTDQLYFILTPCGSINTTEINRQLQWYQQNGKLVVSIPASFNSSGNVFLTDIIGRSIIQQQYEINQNQIILNVSHLSNGVYIFRINSGSQTGYAKVIISN